MSYDTHCSSCGMPYSDFSREGAKSCECHKMAAQAVRDFVFDKPALSAAPVGEPALRMCGYCKTWNSKPCGEQCYLQPSDPVWTSPVAQEPAWRYEIQHGPDGETDWAWVYDAENNLVCTAKTYHAAAIVRASSPPATPAGLGADEIARAARNILIKRAEYFERVKGHRDWSHAARSYRASADEVYNAILALLSRAGDQGNSTQKDGSR